MKHDVVCATLCAPNLLLRELAKLMDGAAGRTKALATCDSSKHTHSTRILTPSIKAQRSLKRLSRYFLRVCSFQLSFRPQLSQD
jgi:hypothetical protein